MFRASPIALENCPILNLDSERRSNCFIVLPDCKERKLVAGERILPTVDEWRSILHTQAIKYNALIDRRRQNTTHWQIEKITWGTRQISLQKTITNVFAVIFLARTFPDWKHKDVRVKVFGTFGI